MNQYLRFMATAISGFGSIQIRDSVAESPEKAHSGKASTMYAWTFRSLLVGMLAFLALYILKHPIATNDGPVHVAFSHVILTYHQPTQPLQSQAYTLALKPSPNLSVYLLMAALMRFISPSLTESIIQLLCVLGPLATGYFAIYTIDPRKVWLTILLLPLLFNQMFFLGLYNNSISLAAFFLVIGTYFWMTRSPSLPRALALSCALVLTFLCHASGFVMALSGLAAMAGTGAVLTFRRQRSLLAAIKTQHFTILAMLVPLPLAVIFLASGGKSQTIYGVWFRHRIWQFVKLHQLAVNYPLLDRFPALLLSTSLLMAFSVAAFRIWKRRVLMSEQARDQALGAIAAVFVAMVVMFAFPDIMGGGWTHFRRFVVFPYLWMILVLAFVTLSNRASNLLTVVGGLVSVWLIASMVAKQSIIREQMTPLFQADALIGSHCTVLPLPLQPYATDKYMNIDWMIYQPFYQSASRLELHDDRVVLFNYLARLRPYPVHFFPNVEPQANLFHWEPEHIPNEVERIDIPGFEAGSGMRVDYILVWGNPDKVRADIKDWDTIRAQVRNALGQFGLIYTSSNGNVKLYQRLNTHNPVCTMHPLSLR